MCVFFSLAEILRLFVACFLSLDEDILTSVITVDGFNSILSYNNLLRIY